MSQWVMSFASNGNLVAFCRPEPLARNGFQLLQAKHQFRKPFKI